MRFAAPSAFGLAILLCGAATLWAQTRPPAAQAQQRPPAAAPTTPAAAAPAAAGNTAVTPQVGTEPATVSGWNTRCVSQGRRSNQECFAEQALINRAGQVTMQVVLHFPPEGQQMNLTLQLPVGILLPAGAKLRLDSGNTFDLSIRTCEQRGCFATAPVLPAFIESLRAGKRLDVAVQNTNGETIVLTMPVDAFAAAHDKVK